MAEAVPRHRRPAEPIRHRRHLHRHPASVVVTGVGPFIVVDQFGYVSSQQKIAVLRDPVTGYDSADLFTPGATLQVINTGTNAVALTGAATAWNGGATDPSSGDRAWLFDFSTSRLRDLRDFRRRAQHPFRALRHWRQRLSPSAHPGGAHVLLPASRPCQGGAIRRSWLDRRREQSWPIARHASAPLQRPSGRFHRARPARRLV